MSDVAAQYPESPRVGAGQWNKRVDGDRRRAHSIRLSNAALALCLLGGCIILGGCSATQSAPANDSTKSSICPKGASRLTPVRSPTVSTLPPSHDNDVGRRRLPDMHPDADVDANQVPVAVESQRVVYKPVRCSVPASTC